MDFSLNVDIGGWFGDFQRATDALLSDMFQLCTAAADGRYCGDTVHNAGGITGIIISNAEAFGETAPQRAARNAFTGAMSKFSGFLDRLIASQRIAKDGIPITRDLNSGDEVLAYVTEFLDGVVANVARDPSLSLPRKLECFPGLGHGIKDQAVSYNALRNALEHHHDRPKRDLKVTMRRLIPTVDGNEVTAFPVFVPAGGVVGVRIPIVEKTFPANERIMLEPRDGYELIFTLRHIIAAGIFQAHLASGSPPAPADPVR